MSRTVIDLDARASVLDAAERVAAVPADGDLALVVAAGAPLLRNAVFIDVVRGAVGPRRLSIVTTDARARSLASAAHVPAYSSLDALERHELDPTERLTRARRAAIATVRTPSVPTVRLSPARVMAFIGSLLGAVLILLAVLVPEAQVFVAPETAPLGPLALQVKTATGDVPYTALQIEISAKVNGTATGERIEETRGRGIVRLENRTTNDIRIPRGSVFSTASGVQFLSTEEKTLPRSIIVPGTPFNLSIGRVDVPIEAAVAGDPGNVPPGRIVNGPDPSRYSVTNPTETIGGKIQRIPVVKLEDYDAAVKRAPEMLKAEADKQLARWVAETQAGKTTVPGVFVRQTALGPANVDIVGKQLAQFELTVAGIATGYRVDSADLSRAMVRKLEQDLPSGMEVDPASTEVRVERITVEDSGVTWAVTAQGTQRKKFVPAEIGRSLAGRPVGDAERLLRDDRLTLKRIDRVPGWWPLLPLLEGRITVKADSSPATRGP
jgi:hypothetical protein